MQFHYTDEDGNKYSYRLSARRAIMLILTIVVAMVVVGILFSALTGCGVDETVQTEPKNDALTALWEERVDQNTQTKFWIARLNVDGKTIRFIKIDKMSGFSSICE